MRSAPANPLKTNNSSFSFKYSKTFVYNLLKCSSEIGWFTAPQAILSATDASFTINLSLGERPVYFPVEAETAPVEVNFPSFRINTFSTNCGTLS